VLQASGGRNLTLTMVVWMLALSAIADETANQHARENRAPAAAGLGRSVHRLMSPDEISRVLRARNGLAGPVTDDFTASLAVKKVDDHADITLPVITPAGAIRRMAFSTADDVPEPIILVDFDEGCVNDNAPTVRPIFESTLSAGLAAGNLSNGDCQDLCDTNGIGPIAADKCNACNPCSPWYKVFRSFCSDPTWDEGIGQERVMFAPFDIEVPLPTNFYAIRYDSASDLRTPDRAEYFWASQAGPGPDGGERNVDYQDLRFIMSAGGERFSLITEIPLRFLDTTGNGATGGMGDMSIATKLLLIDGQLWKITQYFKTILATGSVGRGLSTGHVSLEPGLLAQYEWSPTRYWFGELRFWFPTGGDPTHAGNVLRYSVGTSKLLYETDTFAAIRVLEFVGTSVLTGAKTLSDGTTVEDVDGEHSVAILPGVRFVLGPAGDLGLFELGLQAGIATNRKGFYSSLGRLELRFSY